MFTSGEQSQEDPCVIAQFTLTHSYVGSSDDMPMAPTRILRVLQGGLLYEDPADYIWDGAYALQWYPSGAEPTPGSTYYLSVEICQ